MKLMLTTTQEAWDSYIQNNGAVDPSFQFYPTTMDATQQSPEGSDPSTAGYGNSVFMGANTPGR